MTYFKKVLIALDQGVNTLFGGDPDETISSRAGKSARKGHLFGCVLCKLLDYIQKDHCEKAIERDRGEQTVGA